MGGGKAECVILNGYIGKIRIIEILLVYSLLIFCWCCCFYNKCISSLNDLLLGCWFELALYFCDANFIVYGIFLCF